jgi:hypothetical protein
MNLGGCDVGEKSSDMSLNHPPQIDRIIGTPTILNVGQETVLTCDASDSDGDSLYYNWTCSAGSFVSGHATAVAQWCAPTWVPQDTTIYAISVVVHDAIDSARGTIGITVFYGDLWHDTGEPFIDVPDSSGTYDGLWNEGEIYFDLPSSFWSPFYPRGVLTRNGMYDGPNGYFDEYELFCQSANIEQGDDPSMPVLYFGGIDQLLEDAHGTPWWQELLDLSGGEAGYLAFMPDTSTWTDRNLDGIFQMPR